MRTLVLITSQFPFGKGETFIESELPYLVRSFDRVIIIAQHISDQTRDTPENVTVRRWNPATGFPGILGIPFLVIINLKIILNLIREEVSFRKRTGRSTGFMEFSFLTRKIIKAIQLKNFIKRIMASEKTEEEIVFYSYWLKTGAHAITMLNYPKSIKIARAHGSDLYEEKTEKGYLPLLYTVGRKLDAIFFISQNGLNYFSEKTGSGETNLHVSYLGVDSTTGYIKRISNPENVIVSCSNLVPLKRIHLIIDALEHLNPEKDLLWLHFGDGILRDELEKMAAAKLSGKIRYKFMGHLPNESVLRFYSENYVSLFINVSSTEGIPVSMMEAQSAGIPIIATNTGGVPEIVVQGTGALLPVDFSVSELSDTIRHLITMDDSQKDELRKNAFSNWRDKFNASANYSGFVGSINAIFATKTM